MLFKDVHVRKPERSNVRQYLLDHLITNKIEVCVEDGRDLLYIYVGAMKCYIFFMSMIQMLLHIHIKHTADW